MKYNRLALMFLFFSIVSCNSKNSQPDAWGNFETNEIQLSAEIAGTIKQMYAEEGQLVKSNTLIALLDTSEFYLKKRQIQRQKDAVKASMEANKAQAEVFIQQISNLEKDLERIRGLVITGSATQKQLDDIESAIMLAKKQREAVLKQNSRLLAELSGLTEQESLTDLYHGRCKIYSPLKARVLNVYLHPGELALPGKPIVSLGNLDTLYLRAFISGDQLPKIQLGQHVKVKADAGDGLLRDFEGVITWVSSTAEFTPKTIQTRKERVNLVYPVKVKVINDGTLKIGMPGELFIESNL